MPPIDPNHLDEEREHLLSYITDAFQGVTRDGGVSWSEADAIDSYGSPAERAAARASDTDQSWQEVANNPNWDPDQSYGGFSFLDPLGFRYYLPAAMVRAIHDGYDFGLGVVLTLSKEPDMQRWNAEKWSLLNRRQRLCIKRFLQYMLHANTFGSAACKEALDQYWGRVDL